MSQPHFLTAALAWSEPWGLRVAGSGAWLATDVTLAGSSTARRRGLLDRDSMAPGEALVIVPTQGIHTFGMRFSIDVVGVSRDGIVVSIRQAVRGRRLVFSWRAFAMIELAPGRASRVALRVGDRVEVQRHGSHPAVEV